jgi:glucose-6-phosphate 1-dehydrogenase
MATPPDLFPGLLKGLTGSGLIHPSGSDPWSRVIIEKPFGRDITSARELNRLVATSIDESQTFRIDHYLGKETVQNILVFRFGNSIFEHLWNRKYIDHIQITAAETIGVEHRGPFYDTTGVLRDVVQNHLLEILALVTMETPTSFSADDVRDEKAQLFRALRPFDGGESAQSLILGQYRGYRNEAGVASGSRTPTYAALKVMIDNWRWQGVPIYLRAGKRLAKRTTEVAIQFQPVPLCLFGQKEACQILEPNVLTLRIQPDEGISMRFVAKIPGEHLSVSNVSMNMDYADAFGSALADAYERLLLDCMRGDATLFSRRDGVEESWKFITPVLETTQRLPESFLRPYEAGSDGPAEAQELLLRESRRWREL